MSSSSNKRLGVLLLALGLLLGQGAARLTAQPNIVGGSSSFFPGQATFNSVCTDTTNKDTGLERESAGVLTVTNCGTTDYATLGSGGLVLRSGDSLGFSSSATDATVAADATWIRGGVGNINLGQATGTIGWTGRSQIQSAADGNLRLTGNNTTGTLATFDFGAGTGAPRLTVSANSLTLATIDAGVTTLGGFAGFFSGVLTNTAAYAAVTGAACGAATECFFAIGADGTLPAGSINAAKHRIELEVAGVYGANATDTLTLNFKICTVSGCGSGTVITLATSAAVTMSAATAKPWNARIACNVFTSGASGTLDCQGIPGGNFFTAISTVIVDDIFNSGTVAVDTTVAEFISVSATWSSTNAANTITLRNFATKIF